MPGLGASSKIFEYINLPEEHFECHYLEWVTPDSYKQTLESYCEKYISQIKHNNVVLIGVSFGGIIVQELSKLISVKQVIIISSVKQMNEMPKRLKLLKYTQAYKILPTKRLAQIDNFSKYDFHPSLKKKGELYDKYMSVRNEIYLNWAIHNVLHWKNKEALKNIVHIHGTKDEIFPIKHIENCISIEGGTHAMIITRAKKIGKIIENLLLQ